MEVRTRCTRRGTRALCTRQRRAEGAQAFGCDGVGCTAQMIRSSTGGLQHRSAVAKLSSSCRPWAQPNRTGVHDGQRHP